MFCFNSTSPSIPSDPRSPLALAQQGGLVAWSHSLRTGGVATHFCNGILLSLIHGRRAHLTCLSYRPLANSDSFWVLASVALPFSEIGFVLECVRELLGQIVFPRNLYLGGAR